MENAVGFDQLQGLSQGFVPVQAEPCAGVTMPLNVEAVGAQPVDPHEGGIELFPQIVGESRSISLDEACPSGEDRLVSLGRFGMLSS
jgi:hypothetical protein